MNTSPDGRPPAFVHLLIGLTALVIIGYCGVVLGSGTLRSIDVYRSIESLHAPLAHEPLGSVRSTIILSLAGCLVWLLCFAVTIRQLFIALRRLRAPNQLPK